MEEELLYIDCSLLSSWHWSKGGELPQELPATGTNKPPVGRGYKGGRLCSWWTREGFLEKVVFEKSLREQKADYNQYE